MTGEERQRLVDLLTQTWPSGVKARIWHDALAGLEYSPALDAYNRARTTASRLAVADYLELYRTASRRLEPPPRPADTGPPVAGAEYRAHLKWRAGTGDADAANELDTWRRLREHRVTTALEHHPTGRATEEEYDR